MLVRDVIKFYSYLTRSSFFSGYLRRMSNGTHSADAETQLKRVLDAGLITSSDAASFLCLSTKQFERVLYHGDTFKGARLILCGYLLGEVTGKTARQMAPLPPSSQIIHCRNDRHIFWRWMARMGVKHVYDAAKLLGLSTSRAHDFSSWAKTDIPTYVLRLMAFLEHDLRGEVGDSILVENKKAEWQPTLPLFK